ncbi:MAG: RNA-binding protein [Candidatus ainarchaeum sp.]|nr:RNA-binding protein [Candidatus ainarchaeum sp.]
MAADKDEFVFSAVRKEIINELLGRGERSDGRDLFEYRNIEIQKGVIENSEGSALAKIGKTKVLAAIKFDLSTPYSDRPNEGTMISGAEFLQLAHPHFESGPPGEDAIELARVVDRGIRSAEIIDFGSLFIEEGKVMTMFLDFYILDNFGNMLDTAGLAAAAALTDAKIPKVENGAIIRGEYSSDLKPKTLPVPTTFVKIGKHWILDPDVDEEKSADTRITITTTEQHVCSMQKGEGKLTREELLNNINISFNIGKDIRKMLF